MRQRGVGEQRARHHRGPDLGDLHEPAAIEGVGQGAANERQGDDGDELRDAEQADGQRRAGQLVRLERHGDEGDHRAGLGDRLAHEQEAEVAPPAQKAEVDGERAQRTTPRRSGLRRLWNRGAHGRSRLGGAAATRLAGAGRRR
jgi:hypothetical protein